jgi:class 3 adenylate cyclase
MKVKSKDGDPNADEGEDKRRITNDEDEFPRQLEAFVDGRNMTILMTLLTVFALWGDDIRLAACPKWSDPIFFAGFLFALVMFFLEFLINTVVKVDYKWSFFFWLDLVAAISIAPDIKWVTDLLALVTSAGEQDASGGDAMNAMSGGKTARIVRLVRLIRLIRIVKLYSMVRKAKDADGEEKLKAQARAAANAKQAALKRVEASRLGKVLSEMTTRRVVIGVLLMLFILPNLTYVSTDYSKIWGLSQLMWLGRSECENALAGANPEALHFHCDAQRDPVWATTEGWRNMIYLYTQVTQDGDRRATGAKQELLWLHIPDFEDDSKIQDIKSVSSVFGDWHQYEDCAGLMFDDSTCPYRDGEMELVAYSPWECSDSADIMLPCSEIRIYARFERRREVREEAVKNIIKTLFVCLLLGTMAVQFQNDTQELVIAPIEKMVNIIKQLAEDPLRKPDLANFDAGEATGQKKRKKNQGPQLETAMLENTILKIGGLLQVGFGEAGAEIIGKNMSSGDGELNIMMPGIRINAIFGYVNIHQFSVTTEILQEDVMMFVNKIGELLHTCAHRWSGVANKNMGSSFLLLWKMPDQPSNERGSGPQGDIAMLTANLADRALLSQIKFLAEANRHEELKAYAQDPRILEKFENYQLKFGVSLHVGWAIEGPIGSDFKVDASYLSPHINLCMSLEGATHVYGVSLLMSENFYTLLSLRIKERIRKIDIIKFNGKAAGLYSFMICGQAAASVPENHKVGEIVKAEGLDVTAGAIEADGAEFLFLVDQDIVQLQAGISEHIVTSARTGLCEYVAGNWPDARKHFEEALKQGEDGPSTAVLEFMARHEYEPPADWDGVRDLPRISGLST